MESQQCTRRLGAFINESSYLFNLRHSDSTKRGALLQCWVPSVQSPGEQRVLSTQDAPFAILGSSDQLALYKYVSSQYHPPCDGADAACAVSRVFASMQAGLSGDASSQASNGIDRAAEAQRCGIHSNLLLAIYEDEGEGDSSSTDGEPVAVLELAMHEADVDFTDTCATLREVAQGHGFWIPCLRSARSLDVREVPMASPRPASSSSGSLAGSSTSSTAAGCGTQKQRSCTPTPPCGAAADLRRTGPPVLRRSSIHIADQEQQIQEPGQASPAAAGQQPSSQQQQRQKPPGKKQGNRRQSIFYVDYFSCSQAGGKHAAADAAASRAISSSGRQRNSEVRDAVIGPLGGATVRQQQQQQPAGINSSSFMAYPGPPPPDAHHARRRSFDNYGFGRFGGRSAACGRSVSSGCGNRQQGHQTFDPAAEGAILRRSATPPADSCSSRSSSRGHGIFSHLKSKFSSTKHNSSGNPAQQQQQDICQLPVEIGTGLGCSRLQWQQPLPPPTPQQAGCGVLAVERSGGSGSKLASPFQCGAPPTAPYHRTYTPPHHLQRHIVERGHTARSASASLQAQAAMGTAGQRAKLREQHQQHQQEHQQQQYAAQQPRDNQQQRDQQLQQQQPQQHSMSHWQDLQQQQTQPPQQQQRGWQSSSFHTASNISHAASTFVSSCSAAADPEICTNSASLPSIDKAGSAGSNTQQSKERVRALVAHGGAFRHTGLGGMWSYVGGAQKLVGVPKHASIAELQGQLAGQSLSSTAAQCKIKYALPASPRASGAGPTYVDLENEEDVEVMWEEVDDYAASHKGFRLQLYVESAEAAAAIAAAGSSMADRGGSCISAFSAATSGLFGAAASSSLYASSDSGRGSGGSDSSSGRPLLPGFGQGLRAGSSGLQAEGLQGQGSGHAIESPVFNPSAQASELSLASGHSRNIMGAGQAAEHPVSAGVSRMLMQQQQLKPLPEQHGVTLVPFYSQQLGAAGAAASPTVDARRTSSDVAVPVVHDVLLLTDNAQDQQQPHNAEEDEFLSCMETSSLAAAAATATAGSSKPAAQPAAGTAAAPLVPAPAAAGGDASKCTSASTTHAGASSSVSSMSSTHSGHLGFGSSPGTTMVELHKQKQQQLKALVEELEGRVEVIMPDDLNIVRYLGGGAFGEVYLCRWHGVEVAVKSLSPSLISNDSSGTPCADACADLLKEAAVLASLHHPNIVSVFGVVLPPWQLVNSRSRTSSTDMASSLHQQQQQQRGAAGAGSTAEQLAAAAEELTDELLAAAAGTSRPSSATSAAGSAAVSFSGCRAAMASALSQGHPPAPAIVTEFLSLGSLHIAINGRAEWLRGSMARAKLLLDTARGLDYLHSKRLVHFDLKSANLLVTMRDKVPCVKLADMGLTKQRRQTFVSGINSLRGTLPWIAPEIVKHPETVTEKADIWSFGVCMWQLWTMQEPFEGVHLHALLHQLSAPGGLSLPVPGTPDWQEPECPAEPAPGWRQLMQRCWQQPAGERPSARQLVAALEEMMEALRAARRRTSEPAPGQR